MKKVTLGILIAVLFVGLPVSLLSKRAFATQVQDDDSTNENSGSPSPAVADESVASDDAEEPVAPPDTPAAETDKPPAPVKANPPTFPDVSVANANTQSDQYVAVMQKNIALLDSAKTVQDLQSAANAFERIGDAERAQWLPYYYSGLALCNLGWTDQKLDKDANSARINALCDKAESIEKNAEIYALRNMSASQEMLASPQMRWSTYGLQASGYLKEGMKLDPNNPRLYYLQGMAVFGTPEQFGGGKEKAKPIFEKAVALFKATNVKPLYPHWGQKSAEDMLAKCQ